MLALLAMPLLAMFYLVVNVNNPCHVQTKPIVLLLIPTPPVLLTINTSVPIAIWVFMLPLVFAVLAQCKLPVPLPTLQQCV